MSPIRPDIRASGAQRHRPGRRRWAWAIPTSCRCGSARPTWSRPPFIRDAAKQALDDGKTFYTVPRGILPLREAHRAISTSARSASTSTWSASRVPGAAMLAVVTRAAMRGRDRRQCRDRLADLAQHLPGRARSRAPSRASCGWTKTGTLAAALASRSRQAVRACDARTKAIFICLARQSDRLDDDARRAEARSSTSRASAASPSSATRSTAR